MTKKILCILLSTVMLLSACEKAQVETENVVQTEIETGTQNMEEGTDRALIVKGTEFSSVNIQTGESKAEQYAGKELKTYLKKIGITAEDNGLTIEVCIDPELPAEGYAIHPETEKITISGGDEHGIIYGVYGFLTHYAGMRFFTPDLEYLGEGDIIVDAEYELMPAFLHRRFDWELFRYDTDWCLKNGVNNRHMAVFPKNSAAHISIHLMIRVCISIS